MEPTTKEVLDAVHTVDDKVTAIEADHLRGEQLSAAVAAGIRAAVSDPEFWTAAAAAMRLRAQQEAGGWVLGGARAVLSRIAWLLAIGAGVYALGGWGALVAYIKTTHH